MIPPKPRESQWTDEQWQAIYATGQHTLVAAAAGSGKTAVLVERIIQKILHTTQPMRTVFVAVVIFLLWYIGKKVEQRFALHDGK